VKVVINKCYGGFNLSALAVKKLAEKKGKECYFFDFDYKSKKYIPLTVEEANSAFMFHAYSVPNPQDYRLDEVDKDGLYKNANERANQISLDSRPDDRSDKDLVSVVEELGELANTRVSNLKIVEIPDGTEYEISDYDGMEHVAEKHNVWY